MLNGYSDKTLLDYLQQLTDESKNKNKIQMVDATVDGGWKIHNITPYGGVRNVRQAVINYIEERKKNYHE